MKIIRKTNELKQILVLIKDKGQSIGSVLTMGNLHDGHLSLIKEAQLNNDFVVTSIFINPTQFNNETDFSSYPKTIDDDIAKLEKIGCDLLFLPEIQEIYRRDVLKQNIVNNFRGILCDKYRPGHFDGVTTVVDIFFSIIKPNASYFGEKDFQQIKIIQELVKIKNHNIKIVSCPSIRDDMGMSLSSRNSKFTNDQSKIFNQLGSKIYEFINLCKKKSSNINLDNFKKQILENSINKIDYIEIRNENNLDITNISSESRLFIALYIGEIRIIDNFKLY
ncbi:pantoate--beta-alanine ligase [Pelagibacteraceae bacterium]|nr:pantoate--beta-alanine ligase [Pelagibacteraceae bacterium]